MKKVWINPAFKDLVQPPKLEVKKEEKPVVIKEQTEPEPEKKKEKKEKKPKPSAPPRPELKENIEHKLFQYLMEKQIPIEVKFLTGITFTGKIKWFSDWLINLEIKVKAKVKTVILNRLMMVCYYQMKEDSLSEVDLKKLPCIDVSGTEVKILQQYKDSKTPLLFHVQGGLEIKGTLEWYEKLIYHIRSLDGKTDHTIQRSIVLYFEEVV